MIKKNKKIKIAALIVAVVVGASIFIGAASGNGNEPVVDEGPQKVLVDTISPETGNIIVISEYIGTIEPNQQVTVYPKASGEVLAVNFEVGDIVKAGDVLFEIDSQTLRSGIAQTQAAIESAQAKANQNLIIAENNLNNFDYNLENGHDNTIKGAESTIDNAKIALDNALLASNNANINVEAALISSGNADIAVENALIAGSNADINVESALITNKNANIAAENAQDSYNTAKNNADLVIENALNAKDSAEKAVEAAKSRLDSAIITLRTVETQWDEFQKYGIYPPSLVALSGSANKPQLIDQMQDSVKQAEINVEMARVGVEQAKNAADSAILGVEQAKNAAALSLAGVEQAKNAIDSTSLVVEQAKNASVLSELGLKQAKNAAALSKTNIEQAKISVESTKLGVDTAKKNLNKAEDGYDTALVMMDQQRNSIANQVEMARLNTNFEDQYIAIEKMQNDLKNYNIEAPISGIIEKRSIEPFNMTSPQAPAFVISDKNSMTVSFKVPKNSRAHMSIGDKLTLKDSDADCEGVITEISTMVDTSGLFTIKATVPNAPASFYSGVSVRVLAHSQKALNVQVVPLSVITYVKGVPYLYIAENGFAKRVQVEVGLYDDQNIQLISNVQPSDKIISTWSSRLEDGVEIDVVSQENGIKAGYSVGETSTRIIAENTESAQSPDNSAQTDQEAVRQEEGE